MIAVQTVVVQRLARRGRLELAAITIPYAGADASAWPARRTSPASARFGDFSYGLYLYAFPVQQLVIDLWGVHADGGQLPRRPGHHPGVRRAVVAPRSSGPRWRSRTGCCGDGPSGAAAGTREQVSA